MGNKDKKLETWSFGWLDFSKFPPEYTETSNKKSISQYWYEKDKAMKEANKYYKPELEEFHIGFEYEVWNQQDEKFVQRTMSKVFELNNIKHLLNEVGMKGVGWKVRVKYLDQEDIESFGFKFRLEGGEDTNFTDYTYKDSKYIWRLTQDRKLDIVSICRVDQNVEYLFNGRVKNKSELKRILKMIGYDKEF